MHKKNNINSYNSEKYIVSVQYMLLIRRFVRFVTSESPNRY